MFTIKCDVFYLPSMARGLIGDWTAGVVDGDAAVVRFAGVLGVRICGRLSPVVLGLLVVLPFIPLV
jgi:hypothetical protein